MLKDKACTAFSVACIKHIDSVNAELLRRTSIFQSKIDERTLHQRDIIQSASTALYWLVQRGMAYHNFKSMIQLLRAIGLDNLEHLQHLSMWSALEILMVMGWVGESGL